MDSKEVLKEVVKMEIFKEPDKVNTTPELKELYQHITPQIAADWKVVGILLDIPNGELSAIEAGYPTNVKWCCNQMFQKWLEIDTTASWKKLFTAIESPATSCSITGKEAEPVDILSNRVHQINSQIKSVVDDNTWPPEQITSFTPLLLFHRQGHSTPEQVKELAKLRCTGNIDKVASACTNNKCAKIDGHEKSKEILDRIETKQIEEILIPLEKNEEPFFVLVEGDPGIGKSVLLKEVAFRWGKQKLLQKFKLVLLLYLRDPSLQKIESVDDLLQLFYKRDKNAKEIINASTEHLSKNGGKSLVLLLDGYDEYPSDLQKSSLIADIINRRILPYCGLIVSSRPHASEFLRIQATTRVEIFGFAKTEREHCIKQALPDQPLKIKELTQYLHQQPSIESICSIPFNLVILLYLCKLGFSLPRNSTELYHHFIRSTICRHLSKFGHPLTHSDTNLNNLPKPVNRIIQQLSKLSLEALWSNKLTFTLDEIVAACPDIEVIPGAINGFGLLQAVKHFGLYAKTMTLNFIHFSIQEFLAAFYISCLPPNDELKVIEANFWSERHFNMFSMYISLTKGQRPSFKTFLCGGNKAITISNEFLKDQLKCFRLYHHFKDADDHTMCYAIEQAEIFHDREIHLEYTLLTDRDLECISLFLTSSFNKEWVRLDLWACYVQDKGLKVLYRGLQCSSNITIDTFLLYNNGLTTQSSSMISELTVKCKIKELVINYNFNIGEDQQLYSMLNHPSNVLEQLYMGNVYLSSRAATYLFTALKWNNKLKTLNVMHNNISDDACDAITAALQQNNCLVSLSMYHNPLSSAAIINIVQCMKVNNTLQCLGLPESPQLQDTENNVRSLQEAINENREIQKLPVKLEITFGYI